MRKIEQVSGFTVPATDGCTDPFWSPEVTVNGLAGLKLPAADLSAIERDNALKLLPRLPH